MKKSRFLTIFLAFTTSFLPISAAASPCQDIFYTRQGQGYWERPQDQDYPTGWITKKIYIITSDRPVKNANFVKSYDNLVSTGKLQQYLVFECNHELEGKEGVVCWNKKTNSTFYTTNGYHRGGIWDEKGNYLDYGRWQEKRSEEWEKTICNGIFKYGGAGLISGTKPFPSSVGAYVMYIDAGEMIFNKEIQPNKFIVIETFDPIKAKPKAQISPY